MIPNQQRIIDPYADHRFSNTYSRSSRIITLGEDIILPHPTKNFNLEKDSVDELTLNIGPGFFIKDDIGVYIEEEYAVDFNNQNFYFNQEMSTTTGFYLIAVHYVYTRSFPGPNARYYIIANNKVNDVLELDNSNPDLPRYNLKFNLLYLGTVDLVSDGSDGRKITDEDISDDTTRCIINPNVLQGEPVLLERRNYKFMPAIVDGGEYI